MRVLVVAAHPDDEILGCGGTMAKHARKGDEVYVLILGEGLTSRDNQSDRQEGQSKLKELRECAAKANEILGVASLKHHGFADNQMDSVPLLEIIKVVETHLLELQPDIVYTHHAGDLNVDHRLTHQAVVTACRPIPGFFVQTLLFFEVASSTEWQTPGSAPGFCPNWFTDISDLLELKSKALQAYVSEMRLWPHPRSLKNVENLARYRGSFVGTEAAEAFILGRNIIS